MTKSSKARCLVERLEPCWPLTMVVEEGILLMKKRRYANGTVLRS